MTNKWENFKANLRSKVDWTVVAEEILQLELVGNPSPSGWIPCRSIDGDDENPSASYNLESGYYKDHRTGEVFSTYDLMTNISTPDNPGVAIADNFMQAQGIVAGRFNVSIPTNESGDPLHGVKWQSWKDNLAKAYCVAKPPITSEGLKAAGARMCVRYGIPCFALPVISPSYGHDIVGWMFLRRNGQPFDDKKSKGKKAICKTYGSEKGFVTSPSIISRIMSEVGQDVYWTEGAPDLLAGLSKFPDQLFVTNSHGCSEAVSDSQRDAVQTGEHKWWIIADADVPGVTAGSKRSAEFHGLATLLTPPGPTAEKHGKDYRDHLLASNPSSARDGLCVVEDDLEKIKDKKAKQDEEEYRSAKAESMARSKKILKRVGLQILTVNHGDEIEVFSEYTNAMKTIKQVSAVKYEDYVQFLGFEFKHYVFPRAEDLMAAQRPGILFNDFKLALAEASTEISRQDAEKVGAGIWAVEDKDRERTGEIMLVKRGSSYRYNGALEKMDSPILGRMVADQSVEYDWFDEKELSENLRHAHDPQWRMNVYTELFDYFDQWIWENEHMSQIAIGLMLASWTQTMHQWRPLVTMIGESNSGKTVFFKSLADLFLDLSCPSAGSTAAGIFQAIKHHGRIMLMDEFDNKSKEQKAVLERFRLASRGQDSLYGTSTQSGKTYKIRHIGWMGGIWATSNDQADLNRMINLRVLAHPEGGRTISLMDSKSLRTLGHKMLAGVLATAQSASWYMERLTAVGTGGRYRESLAVPYGCLAAFLDIPLSDVSALLDNYLNTTVMQEIEMQDAETDQEALLADIMNSEVTIHNPESPRRRCTLSEMLFDPKMANFRDEARTAGVGLISPRGGDPFLKVAFSGRRMTNKSGLLRGTDWQNAGINQILSRLDKSLKPRREKQNFRGAYSACVCVDYAALRSWCAQKVQDQQEGA